MFKGQIGVISDRFYLTDSDTYILQGIFPAAGEPEVYLDRQQIKGYMTEWKEKGSEEKNTEQDTPENRRVIVSIHLPENLKQYRILKIFVAENNRKKLWYSIKISDLCIRKQQPYYFIEEVTVFNSGKSCEVRGWAAAEEKVTILARDSKGKELPCSVRYYSRMDVVQLYAEGQANEKCGFDLTVNHIGTSSFTLEFSASGCRNYYSVKTGKMTQAYRKTKRVLKKSIQYLRNYGLKQLVKKAVSKVRVQKNQPDPYNVWIKKHLPSSAQLGIQRKTVFSVQPKFSIVVPLYKTPEIYLRQMVQSVQNQTYKNWELCLSDGSGKDSPIKEVLSELAAEDSRIRIIQNDRPLKIADNTNAALQEATGDYIAFLDHDDELTPNALFECVQAVNQNPDIEALYSDEDKMSMEGNSFFEPHMKPDFNLDLLQTVNYICHLFVVKKELMDKVGVFRTDYDGAQDYDFILRCIEQTKHIHHIPKVLYHWRSHKDSTAENPESKMYAFDAGQRAVQAHFDRMGIRAEVFHGEFPGLYRTRYLRDYDPLISILIPNKDHIEDLDRCIQSIDKRSSYKNYEYIIIENNSDKEETFDYYAKLEKTNPKVRMVYWKEGFNYSAITNYGASFARGEYLLLLNNDTEMLNPDCLEELLGYCMREDVGAVGARLYYEDGTIQHAGVVIGFGGIAGHCFVQQAKGATGYCHRIICAQDYSAVTAACMMVKKSAFDQVDGLYTGLAVAFNDIDFCLRLGKAGYRIVYNPYAELYHYESKSRGLEDTPEKIIRFQGEIETFRERWGAILENGDPYYNPNLTLDSQDFSLKSI